MGFRLRFSQQNQSNDTKIQISSLAQKIHLLPAATAAMDMVGAGHWPQDGRMGHSSESSDEGKNCKIYVGNYHDLHT
jgi:hypothetical protein